MFLIQVMIFLIQVMVCIIGEINLANKRLLDN